MKRSESTDRVNLVNGGSGRNGLDRSFSDSGAHVEPRAVWSALRLRWKSSAGGLVLGGVIAAAVSALLGPSYTTTMQFFVSTAESGSTSDAFQGNQFAQQRVASYAGLLTGDELANRIIDRLDLTLAADDLAAMIDATTVTGTVLIDVSVTRRLPGWAAGPIVTGAVYAVAAGQAVLGVLPPWNWWSVLPVAIVFSLLWAGVDVLARSRWLARWRTTDDEPAAEAVGA